MKRRFLFGQPVLQAKPSATGPRRLFVLGAYPSALHACWIGPDGRRLIRAVAVDNEPEPFWNGRDEDDRIERWCKTISFRAEWGHVEPCGGLNGSSGTWVDDKVLRALHGCRQEAWITDCLDTYYESAGAAKRLGTEPIASLVRAMGVPASDHNPHPSESEIVQLAAEEHAERLLEELDAARPECVVTLGNAALRVFHGLVESTSLTIRKLSVASYGATAVAAVHGRRIEWIPLAHPAAPEAYQVAHGRWVDSSGTR